MISYIFATLLALISLSAIAAIECPKGYQYILEAKCCYKVITDKKANRTMSEEFCKHDGAQLAVVDNAAQHYALVQMINAQSQNTTDNIGFFTAGMRFERGNCTSDFMWKVEEENSDGWLPVSESNTYWMLNQPDCQNGDSCIIYKTENTTTGWADADCNLERYSICEILPNQSTVEPTTGNPEKETKTEPVVTTVMQ